MTIGSNDPHGIGHLVNVGKAPTVRQGASFDPIAHQAADASALRRRALPIFNEAPRTEAPKPEPEPAGTPPIVTRVDQVLTKAALQKVSRWTRQLRRCLKMAAAGNASMARRLRPPDLWLSIDESMRPEAAPWDWDLRPLAKGMPAHPLARSSRDGSPPPGDVIRAAVEQAAVGFADQEIIAELLDGITDNAACTRGTLLCAPHGGALRLFNEAQKKLDKNEERGWATGGWELPCWPIRASPYSMVDETARAGAPKFRITNDLSWPHWGMMMDSEGNFIESINGSADRSKWPTNRLPRANKLAEAAAILRSSGAPTALWGFDCEAFYRKMGRQRAELWRNAIATIRGIQLDERCCFGSAADATKCARVSNLVAHAVKAALARVDAQHPTRDPRVLSWLAERRVAAAEAGCNEAEARERYLCLFSIGVYIDDGSGSSIDDEIFVDGGGDDADLRMLRNGQPVTRAVLHFEAALEVLRELGHESSASKEQPPWPTATRPRGGLTLDSLGVEFDLELNRMRLLPAKCVSYAASVREILLGATCTKDDLIRLLSKLQFAAGCFPKGRQWLSPVWRAAKASFRTGEGERVLLPRRARDGLLQWGLTLESGMHVGVPLAHAEFPSIGQSDVGAIYADASGLQGWAAWTMHHGEILLTHGEWTEAELADSTFTIAEKELLASTLGLVTLAPMANLRYVYSFTDNTNAMAAMRRLKPRSLRAERMVAARLHWMEVRGILEAAERVTTDANLWADHGSRLRASEVDRQAQLLGLRFRVVEAPPEWRGASWDDEPHPSHVRA